MLFELGSKPVRAKPTETATTVNTASEEIASLMLTEGICPRCSALGGHERNGSTFECRECSAVFTFEVV